MHIIVTAGPTREYIDDVRFISNASSGRMGWAVCNEAARRGHEVTLLSGPVCMEPPQGARHEGFVSVEDLYRRLSGALEKADCLVMAAAVGDYTPAERIKGKHKKRPTLTLELVSTRDVLVSLAPRKGSKVFIGFAVESENALLNAERKLEAKSLDMVVLNSPESFGARESNFSFIFPGGQARELGMISKERLAGFLMDEAEGLFGHRRAR